jgi:hypothetical protein
MNIEGHSLREYLHLTFPAFGLILAVWMLRLVLAAAGAPLNIVRLFSVSVASAVAMVLAVLLLHLHHAGGYLGAFVCSYVLGIWAQLLLVSAIIFTIVSGIPTIYSAPEFTPPAWSQWRHVLSHLFFGFVVGAVFSFVLSALLLWMFRRLVPVKPSHPKMVH